MNIANFTKRIWAYIIDFVLTALLPAATLVLLYVFVPQINDVPVYFIVFGMIFVHWLIYFLLVGFYTFITNGRTVGNLIFGLRIIHPNIKRLSFGDSFARSAAQGLFILPIISLLYITIAHTEKSVFDRMTNTIVVDWRNKNI